MRPIESDFKIYEEDINQKGYFNKLVDEKAFFEVFPNVIDYEVLEPTRRQLAAYARNNIIGPDGSLMRVFESNARVVNTDKKTVHWRLYTGEGDIRAAFQKSYVTDDCPGQNGKIFEIGLDTQWFGPNDLIIFEGLRECPLLVRSHPQPDGGVWKYEVVVWTDNPSDWFDVDFLEVGTRILQVGSLIGEATVERGNVHFGDQETYIEFAVPLTRMGWEMKITDDAHQASKNYRLKPNTDDALSRVKTDVLYNTLEMKFERHTNRQKDLWLTYGRMANRYASRFLDDITEKPLQAGPGMFQFFESSFIYDFNIDGFNVDMFREFLPTLWKDKVNPDQRVVDVYTGTGGLLIWQKALAAADAKGIIQTEELNYTMEEGLFKGRKGVAIGAKQYRAAYIEPFGLVRVHYLPFLDSDLVETRQHKGLSITSYEFIVFNFGYGDGRDSNIYILNNQERYQFGYSIGTWSPLGPTLGNPSIHNRFQNGGIRENAYWIIHECMFGLVVKDPSYMVWYRPSFA